MGREQARKDAAFARGEVGVDGGATEEKKDQAEVEQDKSRGELLRGKTWLGRELLTWLLWRSEAGEPLARFEEEGLEVLFTGRITLRGIHGEATEVAAKGALAPYSEVIRFAVDRGLLVHQARLRLTLGERSWEATLDAEHLDVRSAKLPELLTEEEDDRLSERLDLAEQLSRMVDALVDGFLQVRTSKRWAQTIVPAMKAWAKGEDRQPGMLVKNAQRVAKRARGAA